MNSAETLSQNSTAREGIIRAYKEHQDLLILALTGRTGSGCTTAADLLCQDFQEDLTRHGTQNPAEFRKKKIVVDFCRRNWTPFTKITVSSILLLFLIEKLSEISSIAESIKSSTPIEQGVVNQLILCLENHQIELKPLVDVVLEPAHSQTNCAQPSHNSIKNLIDIALRDMLSEVKAILGPNYNLFLQTIGDNVRSSGNAASSSFIPDNLFTLPNRIARIIEAIRSHDKQAGVPTRIVIDAIRNPLELVYLRDRYSPLYAVAITTDDVERKARLHDLGYSRSDVKSIDDREYSSSRDPLSDYASLITQDIQSCLQKADIFISNTGSGADTDAKRYAMKAPLYSQLVRYYAAALHPGIVTPTRDERCMQVAFIAKANSGCISRQVGAAVTDADFAVKAIGWNDVPKGQVPCSLRNVDELQAAADKVAYSEFERSSDEVRLDIFNNHQRRSEKLETQGLPCPYCFKDAINRSLYSRGGQKGTNQVHTRSLHAEENAFLQLTSGGANAVRGGRLFTTASPCELCSKKAYQLGISDIVYIDPYPGISISHVIATGEPSSRPSLRLFGGAVGKAYHRLYEPMLPIKDEIAARLKATFAQPTQANQLLHAE